MSLYFLCLLLSYNLCSATAADFLDAKDTSFVSLSKENTSNLSHVMQVQPEGHMYKASVSHNTLDHVCSATAQMNQIYVWPEEVPTEIASFFGNMDGHPFSVKLLGLVKKATHPNNHTYTIMSAHDKSAEATIIAAYKPKDGKEVTPQTQHNVMLTNYLKTDYFPQITYTATANLAFSIPFLQCATGIVGALILSFNPAAITAQINTKSFPLADLDQADPLIITPEIIPKIVCWNLSQQIGGPPTASMALWLHDTFKKFVLKKTSFGITTTLDMTVVNTLAWQENQSTTLVIYEYKKEQDGTIQKQSTLRVSGRITETAFWTKESPSELVACKNKQKDNGTVQQESSVILHGRKEEGPHALRCSIAYILKEDKVVHTHHIGLGRIGRTAHPTVGIVCNTHFSQKKSSDSSFIRVLLPFPHDAKTSLEVRSRLRAPHVLYFSHGTRDSHTNFMNFDFSTQTMNFLKATTPSHRPAS